MGVYYRVMFRVYGWNADNEIPYYGMTRGCIPHACNLQLRYMGDTHNRQVSRGCGVSGVGKRGGCLYNIYTPTEFSEQIGRGDK